MVDMHVEVAPDISVQEGHRLAHEVKAKLQSELPQVRDVMVHVEPYHAPGQLPSYRVSRDIAA
jgi:divalent metal cation (Fe/Co/Zn/Cd) transporter